MNNTTDEEESTTVVETKHLMIDLETGGLKIQAPILQLGYTIFTESCLIETGSTVFYIDGEWEPGTLQFHENVNLAWLQKYADVYKHPIASLPELLELIFSSLSFDNSLIFSKSTDFDIAMIKYQTGNKIPWNYRNVRDYRTLAAMVKDVKFIEIAAGHDAEGDSFNQAMHLIEINQKLKSLGLGVL